MNDLAVRQNFKSGASLAGGFMLMLVRNQYPSLNPLLINSFSDQNTLLEISAHT